MDARLALNRVEARLSADRCPSIGHRLCIGVVESEEGVAVVRVRRGSPTCVWRTAQVRILEELRSMTQ